MKLLYSLLAAGIVLAATRVEANMLINGSFESPLVPIGFYTNYPAGTLSIPGWSVVGVDSAITNTSFVQSGITFNAQDGNQWIDLAGIVSNSKSSGVSQSVATTIGQTYELTFYVGSALDITPSHFFYPTTIDLRIDAGPRVSYFNPATPSDHLDWKLFTVDFVATQSTTTLSFLNGNGPENFLTGLDNVQLNAVSSVPAPGMFAMIVGLACCGIVGLTRRHAAAT